MATPSAPPSLPSHQTPPQEEEEEDDDDLGSPRLSAHALAALQEFLQTEQEQLHMAQHQPALSLVTEDWRLSQFWYDRPTSLAVAQELHLLSAQAHFPVACIACPSLYVELKNAFPDVKAHLFEYDQRFGRYGSDFTFYDYNCPEDLPEEHHHSFQVVVADPPYLVIQPFRCS